MIIWLMQATTQVGSTSSETYIQLCTEGLYLKMMQFALTMMQFALQMMQLVLKLMQFVLKLMQFVLKLMQFVYRFRKAHRSGAVFDSTQCI